METRKIVLMKLFAGQQWRLRHREQIYRHGTGEVGRRRGMHGESNMEITLPYVQSIANGNFLYDSGNSNQDSVTT